MRVTVFELPRLVSGWRHPGISQQLVWGVKPSEVADLGQDHGGHAESQPGNRGNGRMELIHNGLDLFFDFRDFSIQFTDETDGAVIQGTWQASGTDGISGSIPEFLKPYLVCNGLWRKIQEVLSALSNGLRQSAWRRGTPPEVRKQRPCEAWEPAFPAPGTGYRPAGRQNFSAWRALLLCQNGIW